MPLFVKSCTGLPLTDRFSTGVPQTFLKHEVPDNLVRGTALTSFPLDFQIKNNNRQQWSQQS